MIEVHSPTWKAVAEKAGAELSKLMIEIKNENLDERGTTRIRARIRAFEDVLSWATPVEGPPIEECMSWKL